ncbi:CHAT domain-containing protein [Aquabacterium humicola]|uniref:CHAT domain-containing protein n=1 Tax=Aquabacterium humicola TaxID=3237377 RepID=UPI002542F6E6|nr:CHAT domain-containing protein [Rubrivivax pictus]
MRRRPLSTMLAVMFAGLLVAPPAVAQQADVNAQIAHGTQLCHRGALQQAVDQLREAQARASTPAEKADAAAALGLALHRMRRFADAEPLLREGYTHAPDAVTRALRANDLANALLGLRRDDEARALYVEAQRLAPDDASLQSTLRLNLARLTPPAERLAALRDAATRLPSIGDTRDRAHQAANLGTQALALGADGRRLAFDALDQARGLATASADVRLQAEVLDALAQLYEAERRADDALRLTDSAALQAQAANARELLFRIEWRRGRLLKAAGDSDRALAAYRRSVEHIEAVRQDIPIEYEDGRSSFRETLEPIYLALAELLLAKADGAAPEAAQQHMREARNVVELVKRSELDDFLGERCTVESARAQEARALPAGTAVLYPIIFPDRLELLVETPQGLQRRTQPIESDDLQKLVHGFADSLRRQRPFEGAAAVLYGLLMRPLEPTLDSQRIHTLVVVPDGVLRLLPFGALHDGDRFAIEKVAVVTAPALSLTRAAAERRGPARLLLAGLSEPGPVVERLPKWVVDTLAGSPTRTLTREQTREALALPGVKQEIDQLRTRLPSDVLLDEGFTLERFGERFSTGQYSVVHIASHGLFSSSAAESFLMTYDGLLTIDGLQQLLRSERLRQRPIELLALSACQTAEGDDRAPLGLSGAALKARAGAALGTLWPVSDDAAMQLMSRFYARLAASNGTPETKARALQQVQRAMLAEPSFRHPFHWAAFILVGSWQ